jgi:uncharacterized membrane protein
MEILYRIVLGVHVFLAMLGLVAMVPPLFAKKGARVHRRVGFVFSYAMGAVAVSGFVLAAEWLIAPALFRPGVSAQAARVDAVFLISIAALTGNALVQAISAIRRKHKPEPERAKLVLGALLTLFVSALLSLTLGIVEGHALSMIFGLGSLAVGVRDARFTLRPLEGRHAYLYHHIKTMGAACISAVTAFLVLGGRRIFHFDTFGVGAWLVWLLPGALGGPLFQLWVEAMKRKLEGTRKPSRAQTHVTA